MLLTIPCYFGLMDLQYLNTNHTLYNAVIKAEKEGHFLSKEAQRAAHSLRVDFEKGGIHLSAGTYPLHALAFSSNV